MKLDIPCEVGDTVYYLLDDNEVSVGTVKEITIRANGIVRLVVYFDMLALDINLATLGTRLFFDEKEANEALEKWRGNGVL